MKKIFFLAFFFLALQANLSGSDTYLYSASNGGRLGDRLLIYLKAKWISYKTDIPLVLKPCRYYEGLLLSDRETFLDKLPKNSKKILLDSIPETLKSIDNTYYIIRYYPPLSLEKLYEMREDRGFIEEIKKTIVPKEEISLITPPKGVVSVAVHVRKGEGYDLPLKSCQYFSIEDMDTERVKVPEKTYVDWYHPLKFPPEQYYVDQIKALSNYFDNAPLYLFIFTDHPYPKEISDRIEKKVALDNITFDYRKIDCDSDKNVLADFFSMMFFDCLIRSGESYFSLISDLLCERKVTIFPKSSHWEKDNQDQYYLLMDDIQFQISTD